MRHFIRNSSISVYFPRDCKLHAGRAHLCSLPWHRVPGSEEDLTEEWRAEQCAIDNSNIHPSDSSGPKRLKKGSSEIMITKIGHAFGSSETQAGGGSDICETGAATGEQVLEVGEGARG